MNTSGHSYNSDVLVYDVITSTWGGVRSTSSLDTALIPAGCSGQSLYPLNDNLPQTNVVTVDQARGIDKIFTIGGEADPRQIGSTVYTHYPTLALVGDIMLAAQGQ